MPITPVTMEELAEQENFRMKATIKRLGDVYALANNTISLMSTGVTGYAESRRVFGEHHAQVVIGLGLSLLSALRGHRTQVYTNLRLALEHSLLSAYALANPDDDHFKARTAEANHQKFMRATVYPWVKTNHEEFSIEIKRIKDFISKDHSHANIDQAKRNVRAIEGGDLGVEIDFFDPEDDNSTYADLIHIHYVGFLALHLLMAVNNPDPKLRVKDGFGDEYRVIIAMAKKLIPDDEPEIASASA